MRASTCAAATPLLDPEQSDRVFKEITIEKGDLARGFAAADLVVEGEYRTGHQEQLYIEHNGMIAVPGGRRRHGPRLAAVPVLRAQGADAAAARCPPDKVRVVQTETGGGFGGKEDYPSMIAGHAALLALEARPAGEARLRPARGHRRHHQAPPVDRPPPHRA